MDTVEVCGEFMQAGIANDSSLRLGADDFMAPRCCCVNAAGGLVERTIGWLNRCRRLAKDWECLNRNALAFLRWASIRLMVRKLCQKTV
jgi:hypothetical protein